MDFVQPVPRVRKTAVFKSRTLAVQVAKKMVIWACVNTIILTLVGFLFVSERAEQRTLDFLNVYMTQRVRSENQVFHTVEANLETFRRKFLALYSDPEILPSSDFDAYFADDSHGAMRLDKKFFTGTIGANGLRDSGITGFIGRRRPPLTPELKRRLVLTYKLVAEFGPAWATQAANLHVTLPENAVIFYWPGVPWGLNVRADEYFPDTVNIRATLKSRNPERIPVWSSLYFDGVAKQWNVTYQLPVDLGGKHLINPSFDILIGDLMARLVEDHPPGAYNVLLSKDGGLIAHPNYLRMLKTRRGPNVSETGDPTLKGIYQTIMTETARRPLRGGVRITENRKLDAYISFAEIEGPGWWFVTVYPRSLVLESAREAANGLIFLGLSSFAVMMLVVLSVLRERVARPIAQMRVASERVSAGDYQGVAEGGVCLPEEQDNEIGLLAKSFKSMARKIGDSSRTLEQTVMARTIELKAANDALETLSFRDGLTASYNRRGFDRDLAMAISDASLGRDTYCLLLCDIDHFKLYNDAYGHVAGDEALRRIFDTISHEAPSERVYRYGGEELAVLLNSPDVEECRAVGRRLVHAIAELALPHRMSSYGIITLSAGLTPICATNPNASEVIGAADALLYQAKQAGRNRLKDDCSPHAQKTAQMA